MASSGDPPSGAGKNKDDQPQSPVPSTADTNDDKPQSPAPSTTDTNNDQPQNPPVPQTTSKLERLPTELVQFVFRNADPVDRAMLAVTSRRLHELGGTQMVDDVWKKPHLAREFLERLERDADPKLVPCIECRSLHLPQLCLASYHESHPDAAECRYRRPNFRGYPNVCERIQPALYGVVKYARLGLDTSWFTDADKTEVRERTDLMHGSALRSNKTRMYNANARGLFSRSRYVICLQERVDAASQRGVSLSWCLCHCRHSLPIINLNTISSSEEESTGSVELWRVGNPSNRPCPREFMLPGFPFARDGSQTPVVGPMIGCEDCPTDLQAEIRFGADGEPQLIISLWEHHGSAETMNDVHEAVQVQLGGRSWSGRPPWGVDEIAEASGLL